MTTLPNGTSNLPRSPSFANLFKKYRLRSEIKTLSEFGDLLAEEGFVYETSIFTKWQNGGRVPKDRNVIIAMLRMFAKMGGMRRIEEGNELVESLGFGYLTKEELAQFCSFINNYIPFAHVPNLGGAIKSHRLNKNLSQTELALSSSLPASYIDEIENGNTEKPRRETIDKICSALELKKVEKNQILFIGNYLPTDEEVLAIRKETSKLLEENPYPAVLIDFSWRVICENTKIIELFNYKKEKKAKILHDLPNIIELQFENATTLYKTLPPEHKILLKNELIQMLIQFRELQQGRKNEEWYQKLISKMQNNEVFREVWQASQFGSLKNIVKSGIKIIPSPQDFKSCLTFTFNVVSLINDPRFEIEFFSPADEYTIQYYKRVNIKSTTEKI